MAQTRPTAAAPLAAHLRPGLARVVVSDEPDQSLVGRPDRGKFIAVPPAGGEFVRVLQATADVRAASGAATAVAGEVVDGDDFVEQLTALGLLEPPAENDEVEQAPWLTPGVARLLFNRVAWTCYALAAAAAVLAMVVEPRLRPGYADVWFTSDKALSSLVFGLLAILLAGVHEVWHWLCGRALGLSARFRISRRGIFLVFETDLSQVVTVPRSRRHGVYLAGMAVDAVILAAALAVEWLVLSGRSHLPAVVGDLAAAVAFLKVLGIVQQWALVFLRSDAYALLANLLGCHNLYRATWLTAKRRTIGLSDPEREELGRTSEHDRAVAGWFAWVYLAGVVAVGAVAVFWVVPYLLHMIAWLAPVVAGGDVGSATFWTAVALVALTAFTWLGPGVVALRERRLRREGHLL